MKKTTQQYLQEKILYIGDTIPVSLLEDSRPKFIVLGTPQEMNDLNPSIDVKAKSEFEIACWIAEYAYKKANPNGKFSEPPSMVYEQVSKDFSNFLAS